MFKIVIEIENIKIFNIQLQELINNQDILAHIAWMHYQWLCILLIIVLHLKFCFYVKKKIIILF